MRFNLMVAIEALLDKLVKLPIELQECGFPPALLRLLRRCFAVHGVPSVSHWTDLNPNAPAQAAWCTGVVPGSATDRGSLRMDPLRHRLLFHGGCYSAGTVGTIQI